MAIFVSQQKLVDDAAFMLNEQLSSKTVQLLNTTPTFVTYYHINVNESTVDGGYLDVDSFLGHRSPVRYQKILDFALYGLEQMQLMLQENDQGLDTNYEGKAVILPNTLKPLQNDLFIIPILKESYIFRVTEIQYDTIRPDNFYEITFRLEYLSDDMLEALEAQVGEGNTYKFNLENFGTEVGCFIDDKLGIQYNKMQALYDDIIETFYSVFYSDRYNVFLGDLHGGYRLFDPLQSVFINKHRLLARKNCITTISLSEGYTDGKRPLRYEKSIYRLFERRDLRVLGNFGYNIFPGQYKKDSAFAGWRDGSIMVADIPLEPNMHCTEQFFSDDMVDAIKLNGPLCSRYTELMQAYVRNEDITIYDIPEDLNEELMYQNASDEVYLFTPLLMYIVKDLMGKALQQTSIIT